jgi:NADH:ubiquinone oxidoreductase subunit F (NADH-binding)
MNRESLEVRRLLAAPTPSFDDHRTTFGALPRTDAASLAAQLERAGLTGRGGAGFPAHLKLAAVARQRARQGSAVVVGNGSEGEPLSIKDKVLLTRAPHVVIDGLLACGDALGTDDLRLAVDPAVEASVRGALAERADAAAIRVVAAGHGFVGGEASAVAAAVQGRRAVPSDRVVRLAERGVRRSPTLVQNVETLAHIALIARFGGAWHREHGTAGDPGTRLVSVGGDGMAPRVLEIPGGTPVRRLFDAVGVPVGDAALIGGYHGAWLRAGLLDAPLSPDGLAAVGARPGAGVVHALAPGRCGLQATAAILTALASAASGQCGPCTNGLPRLAELTRALLAGLDTRNELLRVAGDVDGRGACHHPDGSVRMLRSALSVFAGDADAHTRGRCLAPAAAQATAQEEGVPA